MPLEIGPSRIWGKKNVQIVGNQPAAIVPVSQQKKKVSPVLPVLAIAGFVGAFIAVSKE